MIYIPHRNTAKITVEYPERSDTLYGKRALKVHVLSYIILKIMCYVEVQIWKRIEIDVLLRLK